MTPGETLQGGPSGPALVDRIRPATRHRRLLVAVFAVGAVAGAGSVTLLGDSRDDDREPAIPASTPSVQLVITGVADHADTDLRSGTAAEALWLDGVLVYVHGRAAATVTGVHRPGRALRIRAPDLPVRLTPGSTFERIRLRVSPRDCRLASMWTPSARPFTLTWRADDGTRHSDAVGDHSASMELTWLAHMDSVCARRPGG